MNRIYAGSASPIEDVRQSLKRVDKLRSNAVLAVEVLLAASPEFWKGSTPDQRREWVKSSKAWLEKTFGPENVVHLQIHLDERSPHLTGFVVPIYQRGNHHRLSAAHWLDGPDKLADLQTSYADAVNHLGLERGQRGSKVEHERPREYYKRVNMAGEKILPPVLDKPALTDFLNIGAWIEKQQAKIDSLAETASIKTAVLNETKKDLRKAQEQAAKLSTENAKLRAEADARRREHADRMREIPIAALTERLGLYPDAQDSTKLTNEARTLSFSVSGQKFTEWKSGAKGGGAIDFVKVALDVDFKTAVAWLTQLYGPSEVSNTLLVERRKELAKTEAAVIAGVAKIATEVASGKRKAYTPPERVPENMKHAVAWLQKTRAISARVIQSVVSQGLLYADKMRNAVFICDSYCEMRGTGAKPFKGHAPGADKAFSAWRWTPMKSRKHDRLVVCESPIDAMAYAEMHGPAGTFAATGGASTIPPKNLISDPWREVVVAYDNDKPGRLAAERLAAEFREAGYHTTIQHPDPALGKDWNEVLQRKKAPEAAPAPVSFPSSTSPGLRSKP